MLAVKTRALYGEGNNLLKYGILYFNAKKPATCGGVAQIIVCGAQIKRCLESIINFND